MKPDVVIVPCGGAKLTYPAVAGDFYTGSYHRMCRRAADALEPGKVLILSAKYGLVSLRKMLHPYELRLGDAGCIVDGLVVRRQAELHGVLGGQCVALGGGAYTQLVADAWGRAGTVLRPLTGTRGIGEHRAILAQIARTGCLPC